MTEDTTFANSISSGNSKACEDFIEDYTDLVLSKVWNLVKSHCMYPAREKICTLVVLQKQRKGASFSVIDQCDECMDSYIWFFETLKKKIASYKGINNCSLKTYVWSIVNSPSTYKDWLRWKYGRAY